MVIIYRMCGGKEVVGVANSWEDFVIADRNKCIVEEIAKYSDPLDRWVERHPIKTHDKFLKDRGFWAEPIKNFSGYVEG